VNSGKWEDRAARWSPADIAEDVSVQQGRPPRMTVWPWTRSNRGIDVGRNEDGEWWRCRDRDCKRFAGPYRTLQWAEDAADHQRIAHPPRERTRSTRGRTR